MAWRCSLVTGGSAIGLSVTGAWVSGAVGDGRKVSVGKHTDSLKAPSAAGFFLSTKSTNHVAYALPQPPPRGDRLSGVPAMLVVQSAWAEFSFLANYMPLGSSIAMSFRHCFSRSSCYIEGVSPPIGVENDRCFDSRSNGKHVLADRRRRGAERGSPCARAALRSVIRRSGRTRLSHRMSCPSHAIPSCCLERRETWTVLLAGEATACRIALKTPRSKWIAYGGKVRRSPH